LINNTILNYVIYPALLQSSGSHDVTLCGEIVLRLGPDTMKLY